MDTTTLTLNDMNKKLLNRLSKDEREWLAYLLEQNCRYGQMFLFEREGAIGVALVFSEKHQDVIDKDARLGAYWPTLERRGPFINVFNVLPAWMIEAMQTDIPKEFTQDDIQDAMDYANDKCSNGK